MQHGADTNKKDRCCHVTYCQVLCHSYHVRYALTPVHYAAMRGNTTALRQLVVYPATRLEEGDEQVSKSRSWSWVVMMMLV